MATRRRAADESGLLNKQQVLDELEVVMPALGVPKFVPILSHVCYSNGRVRAYNDVICIETDSCVGLNRLVAGDMLFKLVTSLPVEAVDLVDDAEHKQVLIKAGRSKLNVPALPASEYLFEIPASLERLLWTVNVTDEWTRGLSLCLMSVGTDPTHPFQLGVTVDMRGDHIDLYSTDNSSLSRYRYVPDRVVKGPTGDVILPTQFCQQVISLVRRYKGEQAVLEFHDGYALFVIGPVALYGRYIASTVPMSFASTWDRVVSHNAAYLPMPGEWKGVFERAVLLTRSTLDVLRSTRVTVAGTDVEIATSSDSGNQLEVLEMEVDHDITFDVNPDLVVRASAVCDHVMFGNKAFAMSSADGKFEHLISHLKT